MFQSVTGITKISLNFGPAALAALGPRRYAALWSALIRALPAVAADQSLRQVDAAMGRLPVPVTFRGARFLIDCPRCDAVTPNMGDSSFAFGLVRELFVRNCYFRAPYLGIRRGDTVLDCGANRGIFTVYAATAAERVVAVEPQRPLLSLVAHHLEVNGLPNVSLEQAFVGKTALRGKGEAPPAVSIPELMDQHELARVDLLKLDVEGSEFSLFAEDDWLKRVGQITMELHQEDGDVNTVIGSLRRHRFRFELRNVDLAPVRDPRAAAFLYAAAS